MSHKLCDLWTFPEGENSFLPSNQRCVKLWGSGGGGKKGEEEEEEEREEMGDLLIISPLLLLLRQRSIHSTLCFMMCFLMVMLIIEQEWGCKSYTTCFLVWLNFWINFKEGFAARIIFTPPWIQQWEIDWRLAQKQPVGKILWENKQTKIRTNAKPNKSNHVVWIFWTINKFPHSHRHLLQFDWNALIVVVGAKFSNRNSR